MLNPDDKHDTEMPKDGPITIPGLKDIKLNRLTATPASIKAGEPVDVQWSATVPATLSGVTFALNEARVGASGTQRSFPVVNTTFSLVAGRYGSIRVLGNTSVAVDTSACTLEGTSHPVGDIEGLLQIGIFDTFRREKNYLADVGGVKVHLWQENLSDTTFTFDTSTGWLRLAVPLQTSLDGIAGEGSLLPNVWFQLLAATGRVVALSAKVTTDLSLPWGAWLLALADPIHAGAVIALLNSVGPSLASGYITSALGPITDIIGHLFGERVHAVRIDFGRRDPTDVLEPFIFTTVCP
jgi:hypothetical protein